MIEEEIEIHAPDGTSDGFLYRAEDGMPRPSVIQLTDIGGIRDSFKDMARRLANEGYTVLMPNVFYRSGKPPMFDPPFQMGNAGSMKRMGELRAPLTPEAVGRDAAAYIDFLAAQSSVAGTPMGVVGYCFTGALALRTAAARPGQIAAAASFHGGGLLNTTPASPHRVLPRVKARLYFGHATNDRRHPGRSHCKIGGSLERLGRPLRKRNL